MKKLTASIFTVLLATVGAANAEIASKAYVDKQDGDLTTLTTSVKTSLVGAINSLDEEVGANTSAIATLNGDASTPGSVAKSIADAITEADPTEALAGKADKATGLTGATKTKITYNNQGIVTAGEDLVEADIPALSISKTTGLQDALDAKADSDDLGALASKDEVAETDLATALATKINGKADAADLGTAAFTASTAYATAAQGTTADNTAAAVNDATTGLAATKTQADKGVADAAAAKSAADAAQATADAALPKATYDNQVGTVSAAAMGTTASTVVGAIKEVHDSVAGLDSTYATDAEVATKLADYTPTDDLGDLAKKDEVAKEDLASALAAEIDAKATTANLSYTGATGGNVITQVTQANGVVSATMGNAIMSGLPTLGKDQGDGMYTLTMSKDGSVETYKWELIERVE